MDKILGQNNETSMTPGEKEQQLSDQIQTDIDRYCTESHLTYCQVVGILEAIKADILKEMMVEDGT